MSPSDTAQRTVELRHPFLWYASGNNIEADQCLDWRAQAAMFADDAEGEFCTVPVGTLDFATLRLREGVSVFEMLNEIGDGALPFAPVFTDDELSSAVEEQFGFCHTALLLLEARIDESVRGHHLGAWLAAEVSARFGSPGTIVLGWPHPVGAPTKGRTVVEAEDALMDYWEWVGLEPVDAAPHLIAQSTARLTLPNARKKLRERWDGTCIHMDSRTAFLDGASRERL